MQLMLRVSGGSDLADILQVVPDTHVWGIRELMSNWLAAGRQAADFPNPEYAVARFPSEACDINLAEPWSEIDLTKLGAVRPKEPEGGSLWYLDLNDIPKGARRSLEQAGGDAQLGRNRRGAIKNRHDGTSLPDRPAEMGNVRHRHLGTNSRDRLGTASTAAGRGN